MKRAFEAPQLEVIRVGAEDVIATSGFAGKDDVLAPSSFTIHSA